MVLTKLDLIKDFVETGKAEISEPEHGLALGVAHTDMGKTVVLVKKEDGELVYKFWNEPTKEDYLLVMAFLGYAKSKGFEPKISAAQKNELAELHLTFF